MPRPSILVGVDFSEPAARALAEARTMARALDADVQVVHVAPAIGEYGGEPAGGGWLAANEVAVEDLEVRCGTPWVELARHASEHRSQLIVVGSHGGRGYQPVSLGSTALRLTLAATRPVVVVGQRVTAASRPGSALAHR